MYVKVAYDNFIINEIWWWWPPTTFQYHITARICPHNYMNARAQLNVVIFTVMTSLRHTRRPDGLSRRPNTTARHVGSCDMTTGVSSCQTCQSIVVLSSQHWMWNIASLLHTHTHRWTNRHTERCTHTHTRTDSGMWERQLRIIMFAEWHNVSSRHQGMFHKYR